MKNKYTVTITEQGNPEFVVTDERLHNGIEADGILMVLFNSDGEMCTEMLAGVSNMDLAEYFSQDKGEAATCIREALAISEGMQKAAEIHMKHIHKKVIKEKAAEAMSSIFVQIMDSDE